jgi:hypothetical protein
MSITLSPTKAQYLEQVSAGLADLSEEERDEVIQDLSAHLAELSDDEVVPVLGSPSDFVAEFRASAGLDEPGPLSGFVTRARVRLEDWSTRLSRLTRWPRVRPFWVWSRGWLVVSVVAAVQESVAFYSFPIPAIGGDTALGLTLVAATTALSVWLERAPTHPLRDLGSVVFSALGIWALLAGILGGIALGRPAALVESEQEHWLFPITGRDGVSVENIFAYDLEGNPIDVVLFDQLGRPLLTMPPWVYEEADLRPRETAVEYPGGYVFFARDEFGRIVPNLYPLRLESYNEYGALEPAEPPGAWGDPQDERARSGPETTISESAGR